MTKATVLPPAESIAAPHCKYQCILEYGSFESAKPIDFVVEQDMSTPVGKFIDAGSLCSFPYISGQLQVHVQFLTPIFGL